MSEPQGVIDPRSTFEIRQLAMQMAIKTRMPNESLIEVAIEIEAYLLGDNSRVLQPEAPEQPAETQPNTPEQGEGADQPMSETELKAFEGEVQRTAEEYFGENLKPHDSFGAVFRNSSAD